MIAPIEDYALIGDLQTAALVERGGSIDWLCFPASTPAPASPRCSARPSTAAGSSLRRGGATRTRYLHDTLVLETTWKTPAGEVRVFDFMPPRGKAPDVVRIVEGVRGRVEMRSELVIRFDYGHIVPWVRRVGDTRLAVAGPDALCFRTPAHTRGEDMRTISEFTIEEGQRLHFVLTWFPSHEGVPERIDPEVALADTESFWREWNAECKADLPPELSDVLRRSLMVLKTLTYAPTGGIVAAPTTSLPEWIGGVRNWDYRYCWLRDATLTLLALLHGDHVDEALQWRHWLLRAVAGDPADLQIMYGVAGERRLTEFELPWLAGLRGLGAGARRQRGERAAPDRRLRRGDGRALPGARARPTEGKARLGAPEGPARLPRAGVVRARPGHLGDPRRAPALRPLEGDGLGRLRPRGADGRGAGTRRPGRPLAQRCAMRSTRRCASAATTRELGSFAQSYGSKELDASLLMLPLVGFLPASDPRIRGTIEAVENELVEDGFVLRYRTHPGVDGLPPGEGVFLPCSFWLVDCYELIGRHDDARALFERGSSASRTTSACSPRSTTPWRKRLLGNFPQAFTHLALVNSAFNVLPHLPSPMHRRHASPRH